jgi:hypothetical protein
MTTYQTITQDEKSSLLHQHPELAGRPLIVEHYVPGAHCTCDLERGYKKPRAGCCARLCRFFVWMVVGVFAFVFLLRHVNRIQLPSVSDWLYHFAIDANRVFSFGAWVHLLKFLLPLLNVPLHQSLTWLEN